MTDKIWQDFENHALNEALTDKRIAKLEFVYNLVKRHIHKSLDKLTRKDIEEYLNNLNHNKILKQNKQPYSGSTKADIKKFLKQFFKWYKGNNESYPEEVAWIKTRIRKDEKPIKKAIISINDALLLARAFQKLEFYAMTLLLFDSGFRIDELLSVKKKDLTWETYEDTDKCFWIKCNRSKTVTRKIPIPLFTEEIKCFCNSAYVCSLSDEDLLFPVSYDSYRIHMKEKAIKLLKKPITPHALRHSSATYYAKALNGNLFALCQRFGWSFNSDEAKDYVRMSGTYQTQSAKQIFSNKTAELETELRQLREEMSRVQKMLIAVSKQGKASN